jgi:hypothetical protein
VEQRQAIPQQDGDLGQDQIVDQTLSEEVADETAAVDVDPAKPHRRPTAQCPLGDSCQKVTPLRGAGGRWVNTNTGRLPNGNGSRSAMWS